MIDAHIIDLMGEKVMLLRLIHMECFAHMAKSVYGKKHICFSVHTICREHREIATSVRDKEVFDCIQVDLGEKAEPDNVNG